ncbi:MAG TPA: Crp/Fnr family transcriptional regulator [Chitinophagaceae bacterium]
MDWKKLFPQFEPQLIEILEKNAIERNFRAGEIIVRTGQYIKSTVLLLSGRIKIYRQNDEGGEFLIYYLGPGEACAVSLICALQSQTSEITAIAVEDTEVLMLPVQLMDDLMIKFKSWSHFVIQTYRNRFDEMLTVIDNIAFKNMDERLEFYLKRAKTEAGQTLLNLTHQQIADDLNSSREVISRLLKKMEQLGKIKLNRNSIEVIKL